MDTFFLILLVLLLVLFGYGQLQKGVVRTPGKMITSEDEEIEVQ